MRPISKISNENDITNRKERIIASCAKLTPSFYRHVTLTGLETVIKNEYCEILWDFRKYNMKDLMLWLYIRRTETFYH